MNTRLGTNLYRAGLIAAAISILYTIDVIWISESGSSFLPLPKRYISREGMLTSVVVGIVLTLLFWGGGAMANYYLNKSAETRAATNKKLKTASSQRPQKPAPPSGKTRGKDRRSS